MAINDMSVAYPHHTVDARDETPKPSARTKPLPLSLSVYFVTAEKGPLNIPMYCEDINVAKARYGDSLFDPFSEYYSVTSKFLEVSFIKRPCWICRLGKDTAPASLVIDAHLTPNHPVVQYELDDDGNFVVDEKGDRVPLKGSDGHPVKKNGVQLKFVCRELTVDEDGIREPYNGAKTTTLEGTNTQVIPIIGRIGPSDGTWARSLGFSLGYTGGAYTELENQINTPVFTLKESKIDYASNLSSPILTRYSEKTTSVSLKPRTQNNYKRNMGLQYVVDNNYMNANPKTHVYSDNILKIATAIMECESTEDPTLLDPWSVNILTAEDYEGRPYKLVELVETGENVVRFNENISIYLRGGSNGDETWSIHQQLLRQWLKGETFPEIRDMARYPLRHIFDVGYSMDTKEALIRFTALRKDTKVILSTQDITMPPNSVSDDVAACNALYGMFITQPESSFNGVDACRGEIITQCAKLLDQTRWIDYIPCTIESVYHKGEHQGGTSIKGAIGGRPDSETNLIDPDTVNWTAYDKNVRTAISNAGGTYLEACDMLKLFWPEMASVYSRKESGYSSAYYTDVFIHTKAIVHNIWTMYTGSEENLNVISKDISTDATTAVQTLVGNRLDIAVETFFTKEDIEDGDSISVRLVVYKGPSFRDLHVEFVCKRPKTLG
jgi:hypothetical protein